MAPAILFVVFVWGTIAFLWRRDWRWGVAAWTVGALLIAFHPGT